MSLDDTLDVPTNGRTRVPWLGIVAVLWGLLMGVLTWTGQREISRYDERLDTVEKTVEQKANTIEFLDRTRPEDRERVARIEAEQARQGKLLAAIANRLGVQEPQ